MLDDSIPNTTTLAIKVPNNWVECGDRTIQTHNEETALQVSEVSFYSHVEQYPRRTSTIRRTGTVKTKKIGIANNTSHEHHLLFTTPITEKDGNLSWYAQLHRCYKKITHKYDFAIIRVHQGGRIGPVCGHATYMIR